MKIKQTAGRDSLGEFAPEFAHLNDDVLFGEVWSSDGLSLKTRSILTITTLVAKGLIDGSFAYHLQTAKKNGVTKNEIAEILTHVAFYAGWPNVWAAFRVAKDVYAEDGVFGGLFGLGEPNTAFAKYFTGNSYLKPLTNPKETVFMANVTFEPKCRNNWHIHKADQGGGQNRPSAPPGIAAELLSGRETAAARYAPMGRAGGSPPHQNHHEASAGRRHAQICGQAAAGRVLRHR